MTILEFQDAKRKGQKLSMVTCYDYWSAMLIDNSNVDAVLVGDSSAMVMHGHSSTIPATMDMMVLQTQAVARGLKKKLLVVDLPFLSFRKSMDSNISAAQGLMQAGAHAVKLEGATGNLEMIRHLVESGIPVMGHLGLTPQFFHMLGGYKVQGKDQDRAKAILQSAKELEQAGCFSVVLECVPTPLANTITHELTIPTIGIGAGPVTDGQVLVLHDMLGLNPNFKAKFVRQYANGADLISKALDQYAADVKTEAFPSTQESYD